MGTVNSSAAGNKKSRKYRIGRDKPVEKGQLLLGSDQPFDLDLTLGCGQVFRWEKKGEWWSGIVEGKSIRIRQGGRTLSWTGAGEKFIMSYFHLDLDLPMVLSSVDRDQVIHRAIERCRGLRIVRQPPWECLASYICATYSNIPRIKRQIRAIAREFGTPVTTGEEEEYAFPPPEALAGRADCDLRLCGLGYRAPYLCRTAALIQTDPRWADRIGRLGEEEARRELMRFPGVGPKVADCVLLFAFQKYGSVPVDVWIRRILTRLYPLNGPFRTYESARQFARSQFGDYAGYAQEYLFCARDLLVPRSPGQGDSG
jgi:N-glycosylase/DNA lyase